ncbi:unnamed protein product [Rotaria sp. Silwood1]|nr:unnamed protein product [Rotaria sp. Silwood1]
MYPSKFVVYRGQGLSEKDFEKMKNSQGGLVGFNCFLSTSRQAAAANMFAESAATAEGSIGIVFEIEIDSSNVTTPFTYLGSLSHYPDEEEILFSMHAVFRIRTMKKKTKRLWEVQLVATNDNDPDLTRAEQRAALCEQLETAAETEVELYSSDASLFALPPKQQVAMNSAMNALKKAKAANMKRQQEVATLQNSSSENARITLETDQDQYLFDVTNAWIQYAESMQNTLPSNNLLGVDYCNYLGTMLCSKGQQNWALTLFARARDFLLQCTPINHEVLAKTYDYMKTAFEALGQHGEAAESATEAVYSATIAFGPDHPQTKVYEEEVQRLCGFS